MVYAWRAAGMQVTTSGPIEIFNEELSAILGGNNAFAMSSRSTGSRPGLPDTAPPRAACLGNFESRVLYHGRPDQGPRLRQSLFCHMGCCPNLRPLGSERGDATIVAIRPDERAWLDSIRTLAAFGDQQ
jgi:hypothetical protein